MTMSSVRPPTRGPSRPPAGSARPDRALAVVAEPRIRAASHADSTLLAELLSGLSRTSAYQRFLTAPAHPPPARLLAALLPERPAGGAVLAFLDDEVVGHALWAPLADPSVAEIAVVVADRHQHRGIGTALANAVIEDLLAHGLSDVEVFASTTNRPVARMVARAAPDARREPDGPTTTYTFAARSESGALPRTA